MATSKWSPTTAKKTPQSNSVTNIQHAGPSIYGNLTISSSVGAGHTFANTVPALQLGEIRLEISDLQDLLTLVRMIKNLPQDHSLKQEFHMQQAQDRLQGL